MNFKKSKKSFLILLTSLILAASMVSCTGDSNNTQSNEPDNNSSSSVPASMELLQESDVDFKSEKVEISVEYDTSEDKTEPIDSTFELDGKYTYISQKVQEGAISSYPEGLFETSDGNLIIAYVSSEYENASFMLIKVDPNTGKQLSKTTANLPGTYRYVTNVSKSSEYGNNDLLVATSTGAYLFDFDDLSKVSDYFSPSVDARANLGTLLLNTLDQGQFSLMNEMFDVYTPGEKAVYANDDGVFLIDYKTGKQKKIAEHPADKAWFDNSGEQKSKISELSSIDTTKISNTKYSNPRFVLNGKKVILDMANYEVPLSLVGFAVIDLETFEVQEVNYYDQTSLSGQQEDWKNFEKIFFSGYEYIDDKTISIKSTVHINQSYARYDIMYDIENNKVSGTILSPTGIANSNKMLAIKEDTYKGETGKITFYNMDSQTYMSDGVYMKNILNDPVAISDNYSLVYIWRSGQGDNAVASLIIVPIVEK